MCYIFSVIVYGDSSLRKAMSRRNERSGQTLHAIV